MPKTNQLTRACSFWVGAPGTGASSGIHDHDWTLSTAAATWSHLQAPHATWSALCAVIQWCLLSQRSTEQTMPPPLQHVLRSFYPLKPQAPTRALPAPHIQQQDQHEPLPCCLPQLLPGCLLNPCTATRQHRSPPCRCPRLQRRHPAW